MPENFIIDARLKDLALYTHRSTFKTEIDKLNFPSSLKQQDVIFLKKVILWYLVDMELHLEDILLGLQPEEILAALPVIHQQFQPLYWGKLDHSSHHIKGVYFDINSLAQLVFFTPDDYHLTTDDYCFRTINLNSVVESLINLSSKKQNAAIKIGLSHYVKQKIKGDVYVELNKLLDVNSMAKKPTMQKHFVELNTTPKPVNEKSFTSGPPSKKLKTSVEEQQQKVEKELEVFILRKELDNFVQTLTHDFKLPAAIQSLILLTLFFIEGYLRDKIIIDQFAYRLFSHFAKRTVWTKLTILVNRGILSQSKTSKDGKELSEQFLECLKQGEAKTPLSIEKKDVDLTPHIKRLINTAEELKALASKKGLGSYVISDKQVFVKTPEVTTTSEQSAEGAVFYDEDSETITFLSF